MKTFLETQQELVESSFRGIRISDVHECEFHIQQLNKLVASLIQERERELLREVLGKGLSYTFGWREQPTSFKSMQSPDRKERMVAVDDILAIAEKHNITL